MPDFELEFVDGEGETIDVPSGETVVGRGPFLKVNDKRVSRNHGILENVDGQLRLKPTHVNPCFIQESVEETPQPLEKNKWHCLKGGSIFSLLPGKYIYRVCSIAGESTPRNSQGFEEETEIEKQTQDGQNTNSLRTCEETVPYTQQSMDTVSHTSTTTHLADTPEPVTSNQVGGHLNKADVPEPCTPQRKRVLPTWMLTVAPVVQSPSTTRATKRAPVQTAQKPASSKHTAGPKRAQNKYELSLSGDEEGEVKEEEEQEEEEKYSEVQQMPRKRARRLKSDTEDSQDQEPVSKPNQKSSLGDEESIVYTSKEKDSSGKESPGAEGTSSGDFALGSKSYGDSQMNKESSPKQPSKTKKTSRTPCPYGTSCYRKNPIHFQECSHPGDDDYDHEDNDDDDDDDDRPECPYGTDCYRKNPLHKKEYKHTKPPEVKKRLTADNDDDDGDEDRYENSFINDESEEEEVDEDSDYVPESGESDKEDIKRLQKEAKAFLKRKK